MPAILIDRYLAAVAIGIACAGAIHAVATAYDTARAKAPPMPDPCRTYGPGLEAQRRRALARMGRRWLLHPDNRVLRKWAR